MGKKVVGIFVTLGLVLCLMSWHRFYRSKLPSLEAQKSLNVGFLPVTCHLTCPVTDFATKSSRRYRFVSQRFTDFATVTDAFKAGALKATFFVAPLAKPRSARTETVVPSRPTGTLPEARCCLGAILCLWFVRLFAC